MAARRHSFTALAILVVLVVVAGGIGAGVLASVNGAPPHRGPMTVQVGDNVTVNYIGIMGSGPQEGRVFDTSIESVALDNLTYPKTVEFTMRALANYTPLAVSVGPNIPASGYNVSNLTFGGVVTGFWHGLIGLSVNETRWITFPPSEGYGAQNSSCFRTAPLTYTVPVVSVVAPSNFSATYPNVTAAAGTTFVDPTYKWTDLILSVNSTAVAVENEVSAGWIASPNGWPVEVTNVTSTTITLVNQIDSTNVGLIKGVATTAVCGETDYIVSAFDPTAGTYTLDFNPEVAGETLTFVVTVVAFY
jgi:FKBP-type peptidyl-prolyl cis-trans isomerase 2